MKWTWIDWLDLTKLTSLRTDDQYSSTFHYPHHITLESDSHSLWMMFRHAPSHRCVSSRCILVQEWRHNHRRYSLHPSLTNRHRSSSKQVQLITERHVTPLFVPHTTHNTHFPSASELIQRHLRERYRCANTEIMTIRIWNDGNPIRIVETTTNDHSSISLEMHTKPCYKSPTSHSHSNLKQIPISQIHSVNHRNTTILFPFLQSIKCVEIRIRPFIHTIQIIHPNAAAYTSAFHINNSILNLFSNQTTIT